MTDIALDASQFRIYRYGIEAKYIPPGGDEDSAVNLGKAATELRVVRDYDAQIMPYVRLTVMLSPRELAGIRETWKAGRIFMSVPTYEAALGDPGGPKADTPTGKHLMKDVEFRIMMADLSPHPQSFSDERSQAADSPSIQLPLELGPVTAMGICRKTNPMVLHDVTMNDAVVALMEASVGSSGDYKFAMAPVDNERKYETLMLPPLPFHKALDYLDEKHGLYKGQMTTFLDLHRGMVTSSTKAVGGPDKDGPESVLVEVITAGARGMALTGGSGYDKEKKVMRLRTYSRVSMDVSGPTRAEVEGKDIRLIGSSYTSQTSSVCKNMAIDALDAILGGIGGLLGGKGGGKGASSEETASERVMWKKYDNDLVEDRLKIAARERYAPSTIEIESFDVDALDPNLIWRMVSEDKAQGSLEGNWRMRASEIVLTKAPMIGTKASVHGMVKVVPAAGEGEGE